ncbi:MAG: efflux RND transporter permease subunit, partial [Saprospiraceae bacterium]|nr:efflux RND transporter permease subunit [Saprospiraceae bacterium]
MKQLIAYFIKYPVAVNILMFAIIILGIIGMTRTRSSLFPQVPDKLVVVSMAYPGASPEEIEEGIILKIEDNLRGIVGIDRVISVSSENSGIISIEREKDADIDILLAEVKNAVDRVPSFPIDMEPPVIEKRLARSRSIDMILSGDDLSLKTLKTLARKIEDEVRGIDGISQLTISGFPEEEIEVAVRENDLRAFNLTFAEVARAVANSNILATGGNIKTDEEEYLIRANNKSYYGDELDFVVVRANPNGQVIRLRDVATVRDKWSETPDRVFLNGKTGIQFSIGSTNSEDILGIAENIRNYTKKFNATRENVKLDVVSDMSIVLSQRTELLIENGTIGIILVLIFLSLFLKPSIAFWVAVSLPVSFFGMFIFGVNIITINVLSLFGMIVVIGILVDDGIVIGENIYHHYEKGKTSIRAAIDGTIEVIPAIVSAILTTVVAFGTFYFIDGDVGAFFGELATVVIFILLISLIEALIILPSHIAHSNALKKGGQNFLLNRWADKAMTWVRDKLYAPSLKFFLENKIFGLTIPIAMMIITFGAMGSSMIKFTFFPPIASNLVQVELNLPQGTSETITDSIITHIEEGVWVVGDKFTEQQSNGMEVVENVIRRIGPGTSKATLLVNLLPGENREFSANEFANALSDKIGPVREAENIVYNSGTTFGGSPISVSFSSNDINELKAATEELKAGMRQMPELKDIADNDPEGIKEIRIKLRENAYLLGLTYNDVMAQVRAAFFGQPIQRFQRGRDEIRVWVRYDRKERSSIKNLDDQRIVTQTGA